MVRDSNLKKNRFLLIFIVVLFGLSLWQIVPFNEKLLGSNGLTGILNTFHEFVFVNYLPNTVIIKNSHCENKRKII